MRQLIALTALLTAGALMAGVATPAHARQTPNISCDRVDDSRNFTRNFTLTVVADYDDNVVARGIRRWNFFRYMIEGGNTDHNNVNIRLSESGRVVFALDSPDNLEFNRWYTVRPDRPVVTSTWGPAGENDHRANDLLEFEAIFDRSGRGDVSCTGWMMIGEATRDFTPDLTCENQALSTIYKLSAAADYDVDIARRIRRWNVFRYMVHGGDIGEDHNNVNIRLSESGRVVFALDSPDNLEFNRWYTVRPDRPVVTSTWGPAGENDHRANDLLEFEAIFDLSGLPDVSCTARKEF